MNDIDLKEVRALLVGESDWGLDELEGLLTTLGATAGYKLKLAANFKKNASTYFGSGKLEEIGRILKAEELDVLVVDFDLSPSQFKNIEKAVGCMVFDRSAVILEIFNRHARTKESKLQVEIARLEYLMPRLTRLWSHFERQRGTGGGALKGKGMGEKQIEVDRRLIKDRVNVLRRKLKEIDVGRGVQRRHRDRLLKVAMVGYTNAGKSTLLNTLTQSDVLVENALFATLDATVRLLNPKSRPVVLGIDTVGFIDRLPHGLVASFRSTLSEVLEADLLVHVLDASHGEVQRHFDVTMSVLNELGATGIPMRLVFNKMDQCHDSAMIKVSGAAMARQLGIGSPLFISAFDNGQIGDLRSAIMGFFENAMQVYEVVIPYEDGRTVARLHELGQIETSRNTDKGTFFRVRTLPQFASQLDLERYKI